MREDDDSSENEEWGKKHDEDAVAKSFGGTRAGCGGILVAHGAALSVEHGWRGGERDEQGDERDGAL